MKKALLTTALIAAFGTSASAGGVLGASTSADGIQPVAPAPTNDVAVGSFDGGNAVLIGLAGVAAIVAIVSLADSDSTSGTN